MAAGMALPWPQQLVGLLPPLPVGQMAGMGPPMQQPWSMQPQMQPPAYAGPPVWGAGLPLPQQQAFMPAQQFVAPAGMAVPGQPHPPWAQPMQQQWTAPPPWAQDPPHHLPGGMPPGPPWLQQLNRQLPAFAAPPPQYHPSQPQWGPQPPHSVGPPTVTVQPPNRPFAGQVFQTSSVLSGMRDSSSRWGCGVGVEEAVYVPGESSSQAPLGNC